MKINSWKQTSILVGGFSHLEKYEFVNGKDDNRYIMENKTCLKQTSIYNGFSIAMFDCRRVYSIKHAHFF